MKLNNKDIINPLLRILSTSSLEDKICWLNHIDVQWTLSRQKNGQYYAAIYFDGMVDYQCSGKKEGPNGVFSRVVASFLSNEKRDYHDYLNKE